MRRQLLVVASLAVACLAGIIAGESVLGCVACRDVMSRLFGRGQLLALIQWRGIYRCDLDRALAEQVEAAAERQSRNQPNESAHMLHSLIANTAVRVLASEEKIAPAEIDGELELWGWQFRDSTEWRRALRKSGLSARSVRAMLHDSLRADRWIQRRIDSLIKATPQECRAFYDAHAESFSLPDRFRASHLFLAAPPETAPEIVDQKRARIEALAQRLAAGEDFVELVARESEDEETKARGGDLGFFSPERMPPDFVSAAKQVPLGRISPPIRTRLGFHIVQLTDFKPARRVSFAEVEPEIALRIANQKRQAAGSQLMAELAGRADFVRATQ